MPQQPNWFDLNKPQEQQNWFDQNAPVEDKLNKGLLASFVEPRINQLAGKEPGILNPDPNQNPLMAGSWLPETTQDPGIFGAIKHGIYENVIRPAASPLGIMGMFLGENIPKEPIPAIASEAPIKKPIGLLRAAPDFIADNEGNVVANKPQSIDLGPQPDTLSGTVLPQEFGSVNAVSPEVALANKAKPADYSGLPSKLTDLIDMVNRAGKYYAEGNTGQNPAVGFNPPEESTLSRFIKSESGEFNISGLLKGIKDKWNKMKELKDQYGNQEWYKKANSALRNPNPEEAINQFKEAVSGTNFNTAQTAQNKLIDALRVALPARESQENLYSAERAKRIAMAEDVKDKTLTGFYKQKRLLAGELPKVDLEKLKMSRQEVNSLFTSIRNSNKLLPYEKISAQEGLMKLLSGNDVPQRSEIGLLGDVFGKDFSDQIVQMHAGLGYIPTTMQEIVDKANIAKSIAASMDLSAPFRQGIGLVHTRQFWQAMKPMIQSAGSEKFFDALQSGLEERPGYLLGKKAGLYLANIGTNLNNREEQFISNAAEKLPIIGQGVRASDRAYVGFLNKVRADVFDDLASKAQAAGRDLEKEPELATEIARFVNNATGRGSLGRFEKNATELNSVFFSPRFIASRLTTLNPNYYVKADPFVRKEALKSLFAIASFTTLTDGLASATGASVGLNPLNTDFAKSKFGNSRLDPAGGYQQYIVAAAKLLTGKSISSTSGREQTFGKGPLAPTRLSTVGRFAQSKLSPAASFITDMLAGKDFEGKPFNATSELRQKFTPMLISDLIDVAKDNPDLLWMGLPAAFGMGLQTYKPQSSGSSLRIR